jgi:hypothetical protein
MLLQIGISSFGVDYGCQGLNAISSIRRHFRWIEKNMALLEENIKIIMLVLLTV